MAIRTCSCRGCGREFRTRYLKAGLCRECTLDEDDDFVFNRSDEPSTPAEDHDAMYHGEEIPDVDYD